MTSSYVQNYENLISSSILEIPMGTHGNLVFVAGLQTDVMNKHMLLNRKTEETLIHLSVLIVE